MSQFAMHVEVYSRRDEDTWHSQPRVYGAGDMIVLESVDVHIPIAEFYDGVNFEEFAEEE